MAERTKFYDMEMQFLSCKCPNKNYGSILDVVTLNALCVLLETLGSFFSFHFNSVRVRD